MNSVEVIGASKSYDKKCLVLNKINMKVQTGSIYGLIGPSGCGKTTLLSCILGLKQLDGGTIEVLGEEVSYKNPTKFPHLIGYMPQETALVPELTIKETLNYFGNIYQMNQILLMQRLIMICNLLELTDVNKRIEQLSGGEKRRVSFAAALIHDPKIVILDEPTVGLDSILRDKIWKFLIESTNLSNMTVIITTHYIAEAEKATCCGLMSNGELLIEDKPQNIFRNLGVQNLEEAFLNLCIREKSRIKMNSLNEENPRYSREMINHVEEQKRLKMSIEVANNQNLVYDKRKTFSKQTVKALLVKEVVRIFRQPYEVAFMFLFPLAQVFCFTMGVGTFAKELPLGVYNRDVTDINFCSEYLKSTNYEFNSSTCAFEHLSCYFLNDIEDEYIKKIYYNTFDEAFRDAKAAKTFGFISISSNFTEVIGDRKFDWQPISENSSYSNQISGYLDHTNLHFPYYIQNKLWKTFEKFNKKLLRHCGLDERLEDYPLNIETLYGELDDDHKLLMHPAYFGLAILLGGILFSISCLSQSRVEGIWNRTLLTGVKTSEVMLSNIIILLVCDLIEIIALKIGTIYLVDLPIIGNQLTLGLLCLCLYMAGNSIGLFISVLTNNIVILNSSGVLIVVANITLCGVAWPLEGLHPLLKYAAYIAPLTLITTTIRNVALKGFPITHITVYGGFLFLFGWIIMMLLLCYWILKRNRFTD
ncbi:ABC transporter G family member 20-like [Chironomus tepperi]|uniref:ABC transporter G family member 20-like n=1 Tax=Chironomus tepperi TaxID=113505 RepID=UPI00391FBDE8